MNLADFSSDIASPLLALVGAWIAVRQLEHSKQYDQAHQITVAFGRAGIVSHNSDGDQDTEQVLIEVHYRGFRPLRSIRVCLMFDEGYFWILSKDVSLEPGEKLGSMRLEVPRSALPGLHLHVSWGSPHPSSRRSGLRYQALRVNLEQELQEWRWLPFESLCLKLNRAVGRWKTVNRRGYDDRSLPGWPNGRASKVISWD